MSRAGAMRERLPAIYREGELVRGILDQPATQIEIVDEDAIEVQRAHFFDAALDLDEVVRLAAILDFTPEAWDDRDTFRAWVHALRDSLLEHGAVTGPAITSFVDDYVRRFERAVGAQMISLDGRWETQPGPGRALVENPPTARVQSLGGIEPLQRTTLLNGGLDSSPLGLLLVGLPAGPEVVPLIANVTTGEALVFRGTIPVGARLWLRAEADGTATARLEGTDVSDRLVSIAALEPGVPWALADESAPARAPHLQPGPNELWILPVAQFDLPGLDRALLALADLQMLSGRYDRTRFDHSLFELDAAVAGWAAWYEALPAAFDVRLPAGALLHAPGALDGALADRSALAQGLDRGVGTLRAAGVRHRIALDVLSELQPHGDVLTGRLPQTIAEVGPTGADAMPDKGGLWQVTDFDESKFR